MKLAAHYWSLAPSIRHKLRRVPDLGARPWHAVVPDARFGQVRLSGLLRVHPEARGLVLIVHGMGGRPTSHYCLRAASAAHRAGFSTLRLALRGADRRGEDFYHAGLTLDLRAALTCPEVAGHEALYILGYSLGAHVGLKLALEPDAPRLRAIAAVCPPLDLIECAHALDNTVPWAYRQYVLGGLKNIYLQVARRRPVPTPPHRVLRVMTVRDWDRLAVVPRHGFESPDQYYESQSVAPSLHRLSTPTLVVASEHDPMVDLRHLKSALRGASAAVDLRTTPFGGHVAFPRHVNLGLGPEPGVEQQVVSWLARH